MEKLTFKELEALRFIRNNIMHHSRFPGVRELMRGLDYKSPRSAAVLLDQLEKKKVIKKKQEGGYMLIKNVKIGEERAQTVDVPLVGTVACGLPILAEENIEAMIPVSIKIARAPHRYFLLRATGDSMNKKGISDADLVLVRQQNIAENGDLVVALIDDEVTIKELQIKPEAIVLMPHSTNNDHRPIILTRDFIIQGKIITTNTKASYGFLYCIIQKVKGDFNHPII